MQLMDDALRVCTLWIEQPRDARAADTERPITNEAQLQAPSTREAKQAPNIKRCAETLQLDPLVLGFLELELVFELPEP